MGRPFVVCYICGREFGSASIDIHEKQCIKKWHAQNEQRPKAERLPPPVKPVMNESGGFSAPSRGGNEVEPPRGNFNEAAAKAAAGNLAACPKCGRTFSPDRLQVHKNVCKPKFSNLNKGKHNSADENSQTPYQMTKVVTRGDAPNALATKVVVCYICGKQFGSKSISIHQPQCLAKCSLENGKLPRELRRPSPKKVEMESGSLEEYNKMAWKAAQEQLLPCPNCCRRFACDRLEVHLRSCKGSNKRPSAVKASRSCYSRPRTVVCYICGRAFGTTSISIHEPQCLERWRRENDLLPVDQRREAPRKPQLSTNANATYNLEEYNAEAWILSQKSLVPCRSCGRTFNVDRLPVHERSCRPKV